MKKLIVTSLVSNRTHGPMVGVEMGTEKCQFSAEKARRIAHILVDAAEGAQTDAFLWHYLTTKLNSTPSQAGMVIADFRQFREAQLAEDIEVDDGEV